MGVLPSKVGINLSFYKENLNKARKFEFKKKIADNEYLTDKINEALLIDIRNSLLYLDTTGKITRPARISDIAISVIHLIYHANEFRISKSEPLVRSLEQIKLKELKHYLLSFNVERDLFEKAVNFILIKWSSKSDINWSLIKTEFAITTREFKSLKYKVIKYLESKDDGFFSQMAYKREYNNACTREFDIDFDLYPSQSTISNEISKLEAFFTARTAQKYKFQYSPMKLFSVGRTIFDEMIDRVKTPLMPISLSLHTTSSALHFARVYGEPLRQYLSDLSKGEVNRIKELGIDVVPLIRPLNLVL